MPPNEGDSADGKERVGSERVGSEPGLGKKKPFAVVDSVRQIVHDGPLVRTDSKSSESDSGNGAAEKERRIDTFIREFTTTLNRWVESELIPPNVAKSAIESLEDPDTLKYLKVLVENLIVFEAVNANVTDVVGLSVGGPSGLAVSRIIRGVASAVHVEIRGRDLSPSKRHGLAAMSAVPYGTYGASALFAREHKDLIDCVLVYYRHRKLSDLVTSQVTEFSEADKQNLASYSLDGSDEITPENAAEAERVLLSEWDKSGVLSKIWRSATSRTPVGWLRRRRRKRDAEKNDDNDQEAV